MDCVSGKQDGAVIYIIYCDLNCLPTWFKIDPEGSYAFWTLIRNFVVFNNPKTSYPQSRPCTTACHCGCTDKKTGATVLVVSWTL